MRRVPGRVRDVPAVDRLAAAQHPQRPLGHRHDLAPQAVEVLAVQALGRSDEPGRVGEVLGAALVDPDLDVGPLAHERAGGARVVEVDVREQQRAGLLA